MDPPPPLTKMVFPARCSRIQGISIRMGGPGSRRSSISTSRMSLILTRSEGYLDSGNGLEGCGQGFKGLDDLFHLFPAGSGPAQDNGGEGSLFLSSCRQAWSGGPDRKVKDAHHAGVDGRVGIHDAVGGVLRVGIGEQFLDQGLDFSRRPYQEDGTSSPA